MRTHLVYPNDTSTVCYIEEGETMTEQDQKECLDGRAVGCVKCLDDGRIAVLDWKGHTIFVCKPKDLPTMRQNDINF